MLLIVQRFTSSDQRRWYISLQSGNVSHRLVTGLWPQWWLLYEIYYSRHFSQDQNQDIGSQDRDQDIRTQDQDIRVRDQDSKNAPWDRLGQDVSRVFPSLVFFSFIIIRLKEQRTSGSRRQCVESLIHSSQQQFPVYASVAWTLARI